MFLPVVSHARDSISQPISRSISGRPTSTDLAALKAGVFVRLDSRTPVYSDANDRGAIHIVEALADFMSSFESQILEGKIENAKQSMQDLFSLLPKDDAGFAELLKTNSRNAPELVSRLRAAILRTSEISVDSPALRTLFLQKVGETMASHIELAAQRGPAYLQLFTRWTYAVVGWRYLANDPRTHSTTRESLLNYANSLTTEERGNMAQTDAIYRRGFSVMMCARIFTPAQ
jgi:hypothetical protein